MSPERQRPVFALLLALALALLVATAFHGSHALCDGAPVAGAGRGAAMLRSFGLLVANPLHLVLVVVPLWLGWALLLIAAANRAIPPVLGMSVVITSILAIIAFYAFVAPRIDCGHFQDHTMTLRLGLGLTGLAALLAIPRLWRRK